MTDQEKKAKQSEYRKRYYQKHKEQEKAKAAEYRLAHRDEIREKHRKYYAENREEICRYNKEWRERTNYYAKNRAKIIATASKWSKEHPDRVRETNRRSYERRKQRKQEATT